MKQAVLVMAHKNVNHLLRLIDYFDGQCDVFVHIDKNSAITKEEQRQLEQKSNVRVYRKYRIHWGGFSILRCEIFLLRKALKHSDARYFHLLSGQDYPLKPLSEFLSFFNTANAEYLDYCHLPAPHWDENTYKRIQHWFFMDWVDALSNNWNQRIWKFAEWQRRVGIKRRIPDSFDHLFGGSAWFSITRKCAAELVGYTRKHPRFYRRMNFTFVPEEIYVPTVVANLQWEGKQHGNCGNRRYVNWAQTGDCHPANLTEHKLLELVASDAFFARKFDYPSCEKALELIDRYMLREMDGLDKHTPHLSSDTGAWQHDTFAGHFYDGGLCNAIVHFCQLNDVKKVVDLGCGIGWYVIAFRRNQIAALGYDGNAHTEELSRLILGETKFPCQEADLTEELVPEEPYDLTICLSVGEYIPAEHEETVLRNLANSTNKYLIVSWKTPNKKEEENNTEESELATTPNDTLDTISNDADTSKGIVNPQTTEYISKKLEEYGFKEDKYATFHLRQAAFLPHNKEAVTLFIKQ